MYMLHEPIFRKPRIWSNTELRNIAHHFSGSVLNVSGWADEDKQGGTYRSYFINALNYEVSNHYGGKQIGKKFTLENSIQLDLELPIPSNLIKNYDYVLCHTVLEHVFNIQQAFDNLCALSKDVIILVVPFVQSLHIKQGKYSDYWRFTPYSLERFFVERGFETVYRSYTPFRNSSVYLFYIVTCNPQKWVNIFGTINPIDEIPKKSHFIRMVYNIFGKFYNRY